MAFSVLMSLYLKERPENLRDSLDSIFSQSLPPNEVVLMVDGPILEELQKVVDCYSNRYSEIKVVKLPQNLGLGGALNKGLKFCTYELVIRMDTDDICKPDRFEKQVRFMKSHPEISVCSAWVDEFIDNTQNIVSQKKLPESSSEIFEYGKSRCPINHPSVIFRKSHVIAAGGYGPFPEDYYLWGRMMMKEYKLHNLQESLVWFRTSKDVYKRRGGWKYCKAIFRLQKELYKIHYLNRTQFLKNSLIRCTVSLIPNYFRTLFYKRFLRN